MTFDIKKISTAFVVTALMASGMISAETPATDTHDANHLSEHDLAVVRATNVFYNLFATNALHAARATVSGNLTTDNLFVQNDAVVNGSLKVTGTIESSGGFATTGGLTVNGPLTQVNGNVSISQDGGAADPRTVAIGNTTATTGISLEAGVTGKLLYNVGVSSATNPQLNPIGSAENAMQRMVWASINLAGVKTASSGIIPDVSAPTAGAFTMAWTNSFINPPTVTATLAGGTGTGIRVTTFSTTGATVTTLDNLGDPVAYPFSVIAVGQ